ncbi:MAG: hypothetical protein SGILL_008649, partial [Bacillariaceae sp.]
MLAASTSKKRGYGNRRLGSSARNLFRMKKKEEQEEDVGFLSYLDPAKLNMSLTAITEEDVEKWMCDMGLLFDMDDDDEEIIIDESIASLSTEDLESVGTANDSRGTGGGGGTGTFGMGKHPLFYIPILTWDMDQAFHQMMPSSSSGGGGDDLETKFTDFWSSFGADDSGGDSNGDIDGARSSGKEGPKPKRSRSVTFAEEPTILNPRPLPVWRRLKRSGSKLSFRGPKGKNFRLVKFRRPGKSKDGSTSVDNNNDAPTDENTPPASILKGGRKNQSDHDESSYFFSLVPEDALGSINQLLAPPPLEGIQRVMNREALALKEETGVGADNLDDTEESYGGELAPFDESASVSDDFEEYPDDEDLDEPASPRSVMHLPTENSEAQTSKRKPRRRLMRSLSSLRRINGIDVDDEESEQESDAGACDGPLERTLEDSPPPPKRRLDKVRSVSGSISNVAKLGLVATVASTRSIASSTSGVAKQGLVATVSSTRSIASRSARSLRKKNEPMTEDASNRAEPELSASPSLEEVEVVSVAESQEEPPSLSRRPRRMSLSNLKSPSFKRPSFRKSQSLNKGIDDILEEEEMPEVVPVRITVVDQVQPVHEDMVGVLKDQAEKDMPVLATRAIDGDKESSNIKARKKKKKQKEIPRIPIDFIEFPSDFDVASDD